MVIIKSKYDISKIDSDKYWESVRRTLEDIFHKDPNDAAPLEYEVRSSSPDEQVLFYHSEALSTAAEIADTTPTQGQIDNYKTAIKNIWNTLVAREKSLTNRCS